MYVHNMLCVMFVVLIFGKTRNETCVDSSHVHFIARILNRIILTDGFKRVMWLAVLQLVIRQLLYVWDLISRVLTVIRIDTTMFYVNIDYTGTCLIAVYCIFAT